VQEERRLQALLDAPVQDVGRPSPVSRSPQPSASIPASTPLCAPLRPCARARRRRPQVRATSTYKTTGGSVMSLDQNTGYEYVSSRKPRR
jgi:hypothetical protein